MPHRRERAQHVILPYHMPSIINDISSLPSPPPLSLSPKKRKRKKRRRREISSFFNNNPNHSVWCRFHVNAMLYPNSFKWSNSFSLLFFTTLSLWLVPNCSYNKSKRTSSPKFSSKIQRHVIIFKLMSFLMVTREHSERELFFTKK